MSAGADDKSRNFKRNFFSCVFVDCCAASACECVCGSATKQACMFIIVMHDLAYTFFLKTNSVLMFIDKS